MAQIFNIVDFSSDSTAAQTGMQDRFDGETTSLPTSGGDTSGVIPISSQKRIYQRRENLAYGFEQAKFIENEKIKQVLDDAFDFIADSLDDVLSDVERSNYFDDWKESLEWLAFESDSLTTRHRRIIGTMLQISRKQDIADFNKDMLVLFRSTTNTLRNTRINKKDTQRIVNELFSIRNNKYDRLIGDTPPAEEIILDGLLERLSEHYK